MVQAFPILHQKAPVQKHPHHRDEKGDRVPDRAVVVILRVEGVVQVGELAHHHERHAQSSDGIPRRNAPAGALELGRILEKIAADVAVEDQQDKITGEKHEEAAHSHHPVPDFACAAPVRPRKGITAHQHSAEKLHRQQPAALGRLKVGVDGHAHRRNEAEQTRPQQQRHMDGPVVEHDAFPSFRLFILAYVRWGVQGENFLLQTICVVCSLGTIHCR